MKLAGNGAYWALATGCFGVDSLPPIELNLGGFIVPLAPSQYLVQASALPTVQKFRACNACTWCTCLNTHRELPVYVHALCVARPWQCPVVFAWAAWQRSQVGRCTRVLCRAHIESSSPQVGTPTGGGCSSIIVGGSPDGKLVLGDAFMRAYFRHVHRPYAALACTYAPLHPGDVAVPPALQLAVALPQPAHEHCLT